MTTNATTAAMLPPLLQLPTEILCEIAASLGTPDLRRFGRANRWCHSFVGDYLARLRYNVGLARLPDNCIREITRCLETQQDRASFAQTSQRFHPLVMNYVVQTDIDLNRSSLLMHAAMRNLKGLAMNVLSRGGDVNTSTWSWGDRRSSPLVVAAAFGHERMIHLFLQTGATRILDGDRLALSVALTNRYENIAIVLSEGLAPSVKPLHGDNTLIQRARRYDMVDLVRINLAYEPKQQADIDACSTALHELVERGSSTAAEFIKRQLDERVYQMALMLLHNKADPDMPVVSIAYIYGSTWTTYRSSTARELASTHTDPRARNLFTKRRAIVKPTALPLHIGRSWLSSVTPETNIATPLIRSELPAGATTHATLWDFIDKSDKQEDDGVETIPSDAPVLPGSDTDEFSEQTTGQEAIVMPTDPPLPSSFPQLATPPNTLRADIDFWAKRRHL